MGYKLSQEIGRGGQSVVRLATKLETNEVFASKRMDLSSGVAIDKKKLFSFKTELYVKMQTSEYGFTNRSVFG
jgi:hypothetical protein